MASKLQDGALLALLRTYGSSPRCLRAQKGAFGVRKPFVRRASTGALGAMSSTDSPRRHKPRPATKLCKRSASTEQKKTPRDVAVLGGGLTGLTTAYYLSLFLPTAHITLYESNTRLGGWIDTEKVEVESASDPGGLRDVFVERGARTIVPNHRAAKWDELVFYELVEKLGLRNDVSVVHGPSLLDNRYLYYPDRLVRVPDVALSVRDPLGSLAGLWEAGRAVLTEPLFTGLIPGTLHASGFRPRAEWPHGRHRGLPAPDMSIGAFFAQLLGRRDLVDNVLSGLVHGIYGGDVWRLSVASSFFSRAWLRYCWGPEERGKVPVLPSDLALLGELTRDETLAQVAAHHAAAGKAVFAMRNGMATLTRALEAALASNPRVTIRRGEPVSKLEHERAHGKVKVTTSPAKSPQLYDKVISTLLSRTVNDLTGGAFPSLSREEAVTIQVVNLVYPQPGLNHPHAPGFGYLIPSSVDMTQNPEAALGVIFDSDIDAALEGRPPSTTKLTVMLGGHHWDFLRPEDWPSPDEAAALARAVVARHLGIPADTPSRAAVKLCRNCIPQHRPGHAGRMARAHADARAAFAGRLALVGASYTAQGLLPALRAARDVALRVAARDHAVVDGDGTPLVPAMAHVGDTGLARFADPKTDLVFPMDRRAVPLRFGNDAPAPAPW